jgi:branched-subunit amino acid transport protein
MNGRGGMMFDFYLWVLIGLAFLGTASWRVLGVLIGDRIRQGSILSEWINAVAYAMVSGVMMLIVVFPSGVMADSDLSWRLSALFVALAVMLLTRSFIVAVTLSALVFFAMSHLSG